MWDAEKVVLDSEKTCVLGDDIVGCDGTDIGSVVQGVMIINPGEGYTTNPGIAFVGVNTNPGVGAAATTGIGTFWRNEIVTGSRSGTTARVKRWVKATNTLQVGISSGTFYPGALITGSKSGAEYQINVSIANTTIDKYSQNDQFEVEADNILDFTESNPFGNY